MATSPDHSPTRNVDQLAPRRERGLDLIVAAYIRTRKDVRQTPPAQVAVAQNAIDLQHSSYRGSRVMRCWPSENLIEHTRVEQLLVHTAIMNDAARERQFEEPGRFLEV